MGIPLAPVSLRVMGRSFCSDLPVFDGRRSAVMAFRARYSEVVTRFRSRARGGSCRFAGGKRCDLGGARCSRIEVAGSNDLDSAAADGTLVGPRERARGSGRGPEPPPCAASTGP